MRSTMSSITPTRCNPPRLSVCAPGGSCQKVWEARSVAEYSLVPPKYLEFKADDGTILVRGLQLPPNVRFLARKSR